MNRKIFRKLISVVEAKEKFRENFTPKPLGKEVLLLGDCRGRVLAESIRAKVDVPPFDRAAMDGFALRAEDTFEAEEDKPKSLKIIGKVGAGQRPEMTVNGGEAVEISTGAPIPKGSNAVLMVEYTGQKEDVLRIYRSVSIGENITAAGSDIMAGEFILREGNILTPKETGVLAAMGTNCVEVYRKPKVAVISVGDEIISPGIPLEYAKVYDINSRTICDSVVECGGEPEFLGIVSDDSAKISLKIKEGLQHCDVVITSGGTSAGVGDLLYRIIDNLGKPGIIVHGVKIKPGKPLIIAVVNGKPVFGLPGYPTSALIVFDVFIRPILREMLGLKSDVERAIIEVKIPRRIYPAVGRHEYLLVHIVRTETGEYISYPVLGGSGSITTLLKADGFIEIPSNRTFLEKGERTRAELFSPELRPADLMFIGSHCIGLDLLLELLRKKIPGFYGKIINTGSSGGLVAIRRGEADVAGTHLLDENTYSYNIPFLKRYEIEGKAVLVRGYNREEGLVISKGNPKKIKGFEDLFQKDLYFINRNSGSGTRVLLDLKLQEIANQSVISFKDLTSRIRGYHYEAKTHTAVAVAVLQGKADVGLAIRTVAEKYKLDFIPIAEEQYDFVVQKTRLHTSNVQTFLNILRSEEFKDALKNLMPGLTPHKDTGKIIHPMELSRENNTS